MPSPKARRVTTSARSMPAWPPTCSQPTSRPARWRPRSPHRKDHSRLARLQRAAPGAHRTQERSDTPPARPRRTTRSTRATQAYSEHSTNSTQPGSSTPAAHARAAEAARPADHHDAQRRPGRAARLLLRLQRHYPRQPGKPWLANLTDVPDDPRRGASGEAGRRRHRGAVDALGHRVRPPRHLRPSRTRRRNCSPRRTSTSSSAITPMWCSRCRAYTASGSSTAWAIRSRATPTRSTTAAKA